MECRYCGQRLKDGYEYCPNCGGRVEPPEQQARPVQPAYAPQGAYSAPVQRYSPQEAEGCVYGMLQPGAGWAGSFRPITHGNLQTSLRAEEAVSMRRHSFWGRSISFTAAVTNGLHAHICPIGWRCWPCWA